MEINKHFVIINFLRALQLRIITTTGQKPFEPAFQKIYNRMELQAMIKTAAGKESDISIEFGNVTEDDVFDMIYSRYPSFTEQLIILGDAFREYSDITSEKVMITLEKLDMKDHYLGTKPVSGWDDTDHMAFWELSEKVGNFKCLYLKYCAYLTERDKYVCHPQPMQLVFMGRVDLN